MSYPVQGGCLCGAVRFKAVLASRDLSACWCHQCRRQVSGPLICTDAAQDVALTGAVATYRASNHATRGFCAACGSTLYWQGDGKAVSFCHGALDDRDGYRIAHIVHPEGRPESYDLGALS